MGIAYSEFKTTGANLLADIRTAILASTDWSRPNSGARPDTYKAVTTRGAELVIDLADAAATAQRLTVSAYSSYDGTTLGTKVTSTRYLYYKEGVTGTFATNSYYVTVSASKEHLFIMVEGPRGGEAGADHSTWGSQRNYMFICDLVPYFDSGVDPTPTAVFYASPMATSAPGFGQTSKCHAVRTKSGLSAWSIGTLLTLEFPLQGQSAVMVQNRLGLDGSLFLAPYVFADDAEGIRGRLSHLWFLGQNIQVNDTVMVASAQHGDFTEYGGTRYKILATNRHGGTTNVQSWGALGSVNNSSGSMPGMSYSPLVAVPYADA